MKQMSLHKQFRKSALLFGGSLLRGNARGPRPLSTKLPLHVVFKAAKGMRSMKSPRLFRPVNLMVHQVAKKYGISIYQYANVGNHLHVLVQLPSRRAWVQFAREVAGGVAQTMSNKKGFWGQKPFTRVVAGWRTAFWTVKKYIARQHDNMDGVVPSNWTELVDPKFLMEDG
jgi:REP element-mobilizing transposase RayT